MKPTLTKWLRSDIDTLCAELAMKPTLTKMTKTSLRLPEDIWREIRHLAIDEDRDVQDLVADALRNYLHHAQKKGGEER